ncbi:hypothetical protein ACPV36_16945 [Photobacterium damselae]|uniref:hypothetical protein n=1 Tax=Photobacterium damselae TaxID=38293 RepID=UPI004068672B
MKKIILSASLILSSGYGFANNEYIVHESIQGTSVLFEKATKKSGDEIKYKMKKIENGYKFIQIEDDNTEGGNISNPSGGADFYIIGAVKGFENAQKECASLDIEGKKWEVINEDTLGYLADQGNSVDNAIFNIFASAGYAVWVKSDTIWEYSTSGNPSDNVLVNAALLDTTDGKISYQNIAFGDKFSNNTICVGI